MYSDIGTFIDGIWVSHTGRFQQEIINPATGFSIGKLRHATSSVLDHALDSAHTAFLSWRFSSPVKRSMILRRVHELVLRRANEIAREICIDQGKPISEALAEVRAGADHAAWHAEECRRIYGRVIPACEVNVRQLVIYEPVGVCAAFTPWNFPFGQAIRKVCAAIGAGCTIILKGPEDAPSAAAALVQLFHDAGLPSGCFNLVWGNPSNVSQHLIRSPIIRKISFTGSVQIGKELASLAGKQMQRMTMELGGHSPVVVFDDVDVDKTAKMLAAAKVRNAGQICVSPSRFFIHEKVYAQFVESFTKAIREKQVGDGLGPKTEMGPLCHDVVCSRWKSS